MFLEGSLGNKNFLLIWDVQLAILQKLAVTKKCKQVIYMYLIYLIGFLLALNSTT